MRSTCLHLPTLVSLLQRIHRAARESQGSETPSLILSSAVGCQSNFSISISVHLLYNRDNIYDAREDARTWCCSRKYDSRTHRDWQEHEDLSITRLGLQSASQDTWKKRGSFVYLCTFSFYAAKSKVFSKGNLSQGKPDIYQLIMFILCLENISAISSLRSYM